MNKTDASATDVVKALMELLVTSELELRWQRERTQKFCTDWSDANSQLITIRDNLRKKKKINISKIRVHE